MYGSYKAKVNAIANARILLIDKGDMQLRVIDYKGIVRDVFDMACGKNYGNKQKQGDMRTPEGVFHVSEILDASTWTHDFNDGNGEIEGAYGPYFIRLDVPGHTGIGIHGTHDSSSIGSRVTEGCIRLKNDDVALLREQVEQGMVVVVVPSSKDAIENTAVKP
ncbi:MAG: L,D-transpeptidase [Bacteroidales bacterium]|nr:L,D-transpeptidase [Candidatus Colimorpha onthohippi]